MCVPRALCYSSGIFRRLNLRLCVGQRERKSGGESAGGRVRGVRVIGRVRVRVREYGFRGVARWFSACGLQMVRPQPASLLLISAGPVFFE